MCVYLVPSAENLLGVLNKCDFPAREANLDPGPGLVKKRRNTLTKNEKPRGEKRKN